MMTPDREPCRGVVFPGAIPVQDVEPRSVANGVRFCALRSWSGVSLFGCWVRRPAPGEPVRRSIAEISAHRAGGRTGLDCPILDRRDGDQSPGYAISLGDAGHQPHGMRGDRIRADMD